VAIRAITFDFWATLFGDANGEGRKRIRGEALAAAAGVPLEAAYEALAVAFKECGRVHRAEQRTLGPRDAVHIATQYLGVQLGPEEAEAVAEVFATAILEHGPVPVEGALEAVRTAAALRPVGLISDTGVSPGVSLRALLARYGFLEHFQVMVFSDEVGVAKPQAAMFHAAARGLGVRPRELLHLGDLEFSDVSGAHGVGAQAGLFTEVNDQFRDATCADHVFGTWPEFCEALPRLV